MTGLRVGLHGRPTSSHGETIKAATLLSPTLFPIVCAAILGKMLQRIGLYKAERGATVSVSPKCRPAHALLICYRI
jgi:hypothetical protein